MLTQLAQVSPSAGTTRLPLLIMLQWCRYECLTWSMLSASPPLPSAPAKKSLTWLITTTGTWKVELSCLSCAAIERKSCDLGCAGKNKKHGHELTASTQLQCNNNTAPHSSCKR